MIRNSINNDNNPLNLIYTKNYTNYNKSKSQKCSPEPDFFCPPQISKSSFTALLGRTI